MDKSIRVEVPIKRKQPDLPRFVVIPAAAVAKWSLDGTTTLDVEIDEKAVPRRTIKRWDDERWFLTITADDCKRLGVDTGSIVRLSLRCSDESLPRELSELLDSSPEAGRAWERLTASGQRMVRDYVASGVKSSTRARRARKFLIQE